MLVNYDFRVVNISNFVALRLTPGPKSSFIL